MLSFKKFLLLSEASAKEVKEKFPHLAHLDTRLLSAYGPKLGKITSEKDDPEKIKSTIESFHTHKQKLEGSQRDINNYTSLDHINSVIKPHIEKVNAKKAVDTLFDDGETQIHHIRTRQACEKNYGGGKTSWCVAAGGDGNLFDSYGEDGKKMFTVHHKGKVYGIHERENGSIRDERNKDVKIELPDELKKKMSKVPELLKHNIISGNEYANTPEHLNAAMKHKDGEVVAAALAAYHPDEITQDHIDMAMKHPDKHVPLAALANHRDKITPDHIDMAMKHPHKLVAMTALEKHKDRITSKHIDMALEHPNSSVAISAFIHHKDKFTSEQLNKAAKHHDENVSLIAAEVQKERNV